VPPEPREKPREKLREKLREKPNVTSKSLEI